MSKFFVLEPEVPGELGPGTVLHRTPSGLPVATRIEYRFTDWLGDDLITSHPCFVVTQRLGEALRTGGFTGIRLETLDVTLSLEFLERHPEWKLPMFAWLQVPGRPGLDDFGISTENCLIVSEKALTTLQTLNLNYCGIEKYTIGMDSEL